MKRHGGFVPYGRPEAVGCEDMKDMKGVPGERCYALILAGGRSRRMGRNKALLRLGGPKAGAGSENTADGDRTAEAEKTDSAAGDIADGAEKANGAVGETLLERAVRFWKASQAAERVLIAAGQPDRLGELPEGAEAVYDLMEDRGPMAAVLSAFRQTDADLLYVSAVDMPCLTEEAIPPVPPEDRDASVYLLSGKPEPLFGVYRRSVMAEAEKLLRSGSGKMSLLLERVRTEYLSVPPQMESVFRNVNTWEEYLRISAEELEVPEGPERNERSAEQKLKEPGRGGK